MAINAVSSSTPAPTPAKAAPVEAAKATHGGNDLKNDRDSDAAAASTTSKAAAPKPVINTLGQTIGGNLNVKG